MKHWNQLPKLYIPFLLLLGASWSTLGCGILDGGDPEEARVVIKGADGHTVNLVTTGDFVVTASNDGEDRDVVVYSADTSSVTSPFDRKYDLGPNQRIFITLASEAPSSEEVVVKVYIGSDLRYNRSTLFDEEVLEFLYTLR